MEVISGIIIGLIGVISALVTTKLTNKKSSDENYNAIMQKEKNILIENSKIPMSEYNDALDKTILLFKATNSNYKTTSEERIEKIEKLKSIRNKVNLEFPSFKIDQKNFLLHENQAFKGDGINKKEITNRLYLRRKEADDKYIETIEEAVFTMMVLLEKVMSFNKSDVIHTDQDKSIEVNDALIDSYKDILFKLQQSVFHINRLTNEKRTGRNFKKLEDDDILNSIEKIEKQISDVYFDGILNINSYEEDNKESNDLSQVKVTNEDELKDFEDLFPSDEELKELTVAELVITTLDRLKKADLEIIEKWSSSATSNRYLLNTTPKHKNGQDFVNYHIYPTNNIFIEAHHSKNNIKRLLEKYILEVLKKNGQLNEDNEKKKPKRNFSNEELGFIERHSLNKNGSIRNIITSALKSLEEQYDIRPMNLSDKRALISKTNANPNGVKLPKANKYVAKNGKEYYFNTHMSAPNAIKSLRKYEEFLDK